MKRSILGFIVGLVAWALVASLLNRSLRFGLESYAAAEPQMTFTHAMLLTVCGNVWCTLSG